MSKHKRFTPPAGPGSVVTKAPTRLHRQQFDLLAARMDGAAIARRHFDLVAAISATHQGAQADAITKAQELQQTLVALGLDPAVNYQIDRATGTVTPVAPPPAAKKGGRRAAV